MDPQLRSRYAGSFRRIEDIKIVDERTVEFFLDEDHATFLTDLEFPILRKEEANTPLNADREPVGAGPYRLVGRTMGRLQLEANPNWHRGTPNAEKLSLVVIRDDNTRALRMLAGAGDVALNAIPPRLVPLFEDDNDFVVDSVPGIATMYLGFNTEAPQLSDPLVRRAIAYAIDRNAIVKAKYGGRAQLAQSWIPPKHWAHSNVPSPSYDPAEARRAIGRPPDGRILMGRGKRLE